MTNQTPLIARRGADYADQPARQFRSEVSPLDRVLGIDADRARLYLNDFRELELHDLPAVTEAAALLEKARRLPRPALGPDPATDAVAAILNGADIVDTARAVTDHQAIAATANKLHAQAVARCHHQAAQVLADAIAADEHIPPMRDAFDRLVDQAVDLDQALPGQVTSTVAAAETGVEALAQWKQFRAVADLALDLIGYATKLRLTGVAPRPKTTPTSYLADVDWYGAARPDLPLGPGRHLLLRRLRGGQGPGVFTKSEIEANYTRWLDNKPSR